MQNGLVIKDNRIVVPTSVRKDIIATVHRSHQGIQGCIRRAKDAVYWPLMNQEITDYVKQCSVCNTYRPEQCKEPLMLHAVPGAGFTNRTYTTQLLSATHVRKLYGVQPTQGSLTPGFTKLA